MTQVEKYNKTFEMLLPPLVGFWRWSKVLSNGVDQACRGEEPAQKSNTEASQRPVQI